MYQLDDYYFELPESLIAQHPVANRENARLLALDRHSGQTSHHRFTDICNFLAPGDALVINNTAVVPARLIGKKKTGGKVSLLIINYAEGIQKKDHAGRLTYQCLIKAAKRPRPGTRIEFDQNLSAEVVNFNNGVFTVVFTCGEDFETLLHRIGNVPLPPYIKRAEDGPSHRDAASYQTVYAANKGAAAAPTAGLHFSVPLLEKIKQRGIHVVPITLHVGYGTFVPVRVTDIRTHHMHSEPFIIPRNTAETINQVKLAGKRVVAVGTTTVRTLEYAADVRGKIHPGTGHSDLFIYPGYRFKTVNAMITNFHLPKSTLLMLVSAFAGKTDIFAAYEEAVQEKYRFFSYGDAMYIR